MRVTFDLDDKLDHKLMREAKKDGHENRSAIIRKAIGFFLSSMSSNSKKRQETNS